MMFDKLAKWAETEAPEHKARVDAARLFVVPEVYTSFIAVRDKSHFPGFDQQTLDDETFRYPTLRDRPDSALIEKFELPFETVAVERTIHDRYDDPDDGWTYARKTCVVLSRTSEAGTFEYIAGEPETGIESRGSIEVMRGLVRVGLWESFYEDGPNFVGRFNFTYKRWESQIVGFGPRTWSRGTFNGEWDAPVAHQMNEEEAQQWVRLIAKKRAGVDPRSEYISPDEEESTLRWQQNVFRRFIEPVEIALQTVLKINDPSRIVLREERLDARPPQKGRIWRSNQRPLYTAIDRREARTVIPRPARTGGSKGPVAHERRGHWRRLPEDEVRLPKKHGQLVWVKPCWIGPTEAIVGNKRYRVYLEPESNESNRQERAS